MNEKTSEDNIKRIVFESRPDHSYAIENDTVYADIEIFDIMCETVKKFHQLKEKNAR